MIKFDENNNKIKKNIVGLKFACQIVTCGFDKTKHINKSKFFLSKKIECDINKKAIAVIK